MLGNITASKHSDILAMLSYVSVKMLVYALLLFYHDLYLDSNNRSTHTEIKIIIIL